jgi:hypothetical protein
VVAYYFYYLFNKIIKDSLIVFFVLKTRQIPPIKMISPLIFGSKDEVEGAIAFFLQMDFFSLVPVSVLRLLLQQLQQQTF